MTIGAMMPSVEGVSNNAGVAREASIAMLDKSMDLMEDMGAGLTKMMEQSVYPHIGGNIDVSL